MAQKKATTPGTIDEYLAARPQEAVADLALIRSAVHEACPEAVESISYGMPTFKLGGKPLIYVAAWKGHVSLYGTVDGNLKFPIGEPPAPDYVKQLVRARMDILAPGGPGASGARG